MTDIVQEFDDGCTVYVRSSWSAAWSSLDAMIPLSLRRTLGSDFDTARCLFRSGEILEDGDPDFVTVTRALGGLFLGYYVRIVRTTAPTLDWVGYIVEEDRSEMSAPNDGTSLEPYGADHVYTAVGIEWFLDRRQIISATHYFDVSDVTTTSRAIGFNMGFGYDRDLSQSQRGNKDTRDDPNGVPVFAESPSNAELWNASEMVDYLLAYHPPRDVNDNPAGPEWNYDKATYSSYLDWHSPAIDLENRTVLQALRSILNPQRGIVWWAEYNATFDRMDLKVNTIAPTAVALPGGETLPAALSLNFNPDQDSQIASFRATRSRETMYDRVRVRGARRVSVFTVAIEDGTLEPGWNTSVIEAAYKAAGSLTNAEAADRLRRSEEYATVYTRFRIPQTWNGKSGNGAAAYVTEFACPIMPQGSTSIVGTEQVSISGLRLLRVLPLKRGYDYSTAGSPTANDTTNEPAEYALPFGAIKHDDQWYLLHSSASQLDETTAGSKRLKTSYALRMLNSVPGFEVLPTLGMQHAIAKNHFDTGSPAPSKTTPEVDYEDMRVTVAAEWDAFCEGYHPDTAPTANPLQELVISIGDRARLDYLAKGTMLDIDNASIKICTTGGPVRDDREFCRRLAQVAFEWYSRPRSSFVCEFHTIQEPIGIGDYVRHYGNAAVLREANAIVTMVEHNFQAGKTTIMGGFAELDFGALL